MSEYAYLTYYQKIRDVILNRAKDYYENDKERNLSEEEKNKKRGYVKNRYRNMSEEKIKRLKNIKKIIARPKSLNIIVNKIIF